MRRYAWRGWCLVGVVGGLACASADDARAPTGGAAGTGMGGSTGSSGSTGMGGSTGSSGNTGMGGSTGSSGSTGMGGNAGTGGSAGTAGSAGSGGTGGSRDAAADSAPDASGDGAAVDARMEGGMGADSAWGDDGSVCSTCRCVAGVHDWYLRRTDGRLLTEIGGPTPSQVVVLDAANGSPLQNVVHAAGGAAHGCAVLSSGTVACWREAAQNSNAFGQLGNGATDTNNGPLYRATPVLVGAGQALMNVAELTHGADTNFTSCALTRDGKIWCWGDLTWITNGGTTMNSAYAVPVTANGAMPLDRVIQASMSTYFACALLMKDTTREVWCWGSNYHGNVGQTDKMPRRYPTRVLGLTDPSLVRVIGYDATGNLGGTACAIDGAQVKCWGSNAAGAAGVGNANDPILAPTPVVLQNATPLSGANGLEGAPGGGGSFCAHSSANALWCWGSGFANYAGNYGATNVIAQGSFYRPSASVAHPRFLTGDGVYHIGPTAVMPNCGAL